MEKFKDQKPYINRRDYDNSIRQTNVSEIRTIDFDNLVGTPEFPKNGNRNMYKTDKDSGINIKGLTFRGFTSKHSMETFLMTPLDSNGVYVLRGLVQNGCLMGGRHRLQVLFPRGVSAFGTDIGCSSNVSATSTIVDIYVKCQGEKKAQKISGIVLTNEAQFFGVNLPGREIEYVDIFPNIQHEDKIPYVIIDNVTFAVSRGIYPRLGSETSSLPPPSRATPNRVVAFQTTPTNKGATNYCAQCVTACIIKAWNKHQGLRDQDLIDNIYDKYPPNVAGGFFGTSPERVTDILKKFGLQTHTLIMNPSWNSISGGNRSSFGEPAPLFDFGVVQNNLKLWVSHWARIQDIVSRGYPVIVLVDYGVIEKQYNFHWMVITSVRDGKVTILQALPDYGEKSIDEKIFAAAWECKVLPDLFHSGQPVGVASLRFHAIVAWPRDEKSPI